MPSTRRAPFYVCLSLIFSCCAVVAQSDSISNLPPAVYQQLAMLTSTDGQSYDMFGSSVAISTDGNTIVVGISNYQHDAAYVFVKPSTGWADATPTAELTPSDGSSGDQFGLSVAIANNTIFVSSRVSTLVTSFQYAQGAVYVYEEPAGGWISSTETAKLTVNPTFYYIGRNIAAAGNSVAAIFTSQNGPPTAGGVFVWNKPASGWAKTAAAASLITSNNDYSITTVAMSSSGNTIVMSDPSEGIVYLYTRPSGGWTGKNLTQSAQLITSDGNTTDYLGTSLAVTDSTVVAGAYGRNSFQGAAYVYVKPSGGWANAQENAQLSAPNGPELGASVAISGNTIFAGSPVANIGGTYQAGAIFVYNKPSTGWKTTSHFASELAATDGIESAHLGSSLAVAGSTIISGAPNATLGSNTQQGTAYVFGP
jgi:hypothetical protein